MYLFFMICLTVLAIAIAVWIYLYLSRKALDGSLRDDNEAAGKPLVRAPQPRTSAKPAESHPLPSPAAPAAASGAAPDETASADGGKEAGTAADESASDDNDAAAGPVAGSTLFTAPAGTKDELTKITGMGPVAERRLNEQGITTFAQIAALTDDDIRRIDERMPFSQKRVREWRTQARKLS